MNEVGQDKQSTLSGMARSNMGWGLHPEPHGGIEMKVKCDFHEFSEWELKIVRRIAGQMVRTGVFNANDRDDVGQELLLHLWKKREEFCSDHASRCGYETYIRKILNKKRTDLIRERALLLSKERCEVVATEYGLSDSNEITKTSVTSFLPHKEFNVEDAVIFQLELRRIMSRLSSRKQQICTLLNDGYRPADIAKMLNISRGTVYDHIRELRTILEIEFHLNTKKQERRETQNV